MDETEAIRAEREERIRELEARQRRRPPAVRAPVALVSIAIALLIFSREWPDVAYFFSPREPVVLGHEGAYRFDLLTPNRYVQLHGTPTRRAAFARDGDDVEVAVGLIGTPIIVRRPALPSEDWPPGFKTPPPPDQTPFSVGGRLVPRSYGLYRGEFRAVDDLGEVKPRDGELWMVLEGDRPAQHWPALVLAIALLAFVALNAYFAVRDVRYRVALRRNERVSPQS